MKIIIIGAGAAGLAAACASDKNNEIILIDKNEKIGKKIYITGKGRCNITNNCSDETFFENIVTNPKFLTSSYKSFNCKSTIEFFENSGLKLKTERGNRVFPESDKSSDIIKIFSKKIAENNVKLHLGEKVTDIVFSNNTIKEIITDKQIIKIASEDKVIIATGGKSYPQTGSTGDGYKFAIKAGHKIIPLKAALVAIILNYPKKYNTQGLSLKNVTVSLKNSDGKTIVKEFGEMLFTEDGISGPAVLSLSSKINKIDLKNHYVEIDLKPALSYEKLDMRLIREFDGNKNKNLKYVLYNLSPKALAPIIADNANIDENRKINEITKAERIKIINAIKGLKFQIKSLAPIDTGIITSGGVAVNEINPKTMESKIIKNLYFCGEIIDVDALTGGFNLQIALSTGFAAGRAASKTV